MRINKFTILGMIFQAWTDTAPHRCFRLRVYPIMSGTHRSKVDESAFIRFLWWQDMIVECTFIIIYITWVRFVGVVNVSGVLIKHFGQPEHVVSIASLRSLNVIQHRRKVVRWMKMFAYAVPADTHGTVIDYGIPEKTGCMIPFCCMIPVFVILWNFGYPFVSDYFRNLCVGMHSV